MSISRLVARQTNLWTCLKYASPIPRDWTVFAGFVFFILYLISLHWGKTKKSTKTSPFSWEQELESWWVWEEGESSPGHFLLWAGKVKLPELPKTSIFFSRLWLPVQWADETQPTLPQNCCFLEELCFHQHFLQNSFLMPNQFFFNRSPPFLGSPGQIPILWAKFLAWWPFPVTFSHSCPTQPWKPLPPPPLPIKANKN